MGKSETPQRFTEMTPARIPSSSSDTTVHDMKETSDSGLWSVLCLAAEA